MGVRRGRAVEVRPLQNQYADRVMMRDVKVISPRTGAGNSAPPAALAVAVFRVLDLWLPVLAGLVAARGELSNRD